MYCSQGVIMIQNEALSIRDDGYISTAVPSAASLERPLSYDRAGVHQPGSHHLPELLYA